MSKTTAKKGGRNPQRKGSVDPTTVRFEATKLDALFSVLDAIAWLDLPNVGSISQFAGIDPRTAGKLLKNCVSLAIVDGGDSAYRATHDSPQT
jgi:hypothetical protein